MKSFILSLTGGNLWGFPCGSVGKESACNAGDLGSIPGSKSSPGEGNGNPLQYSCLKNPMDRGDWQATVYRAAKSWTRLKRQSMHTPGPSRASVVAQSLKNSPVMQETACSAGDLGSDPRSERSPGEGNDNPLQYSGLEYSMYWIVRMVSKELDMTE